MPPKKRNPDSDNDVQKKKRRKRKNGGDEGLEDSSKIPGFLQADNEDDDPSVDIVSFLPATDCRLMLIHIIVLIILLRIYQK